MVVVVLWPDLSPPLHALATMLKQTMAISHVRTDRFDLIEFIGNPFVVAVANTLPYMTFQTGDEFALTAKSSANLVERAARWVALTGLD